ncbi:MAG: glycosyltransferase family 4 protein [Candidatus Omnitrophota bacterium]
MTVLFLTTHLNTGGITSYILTLGQELRRRGHQVIVASSGGNMEPIFEQAGLTHEQLDLRTKNIFSLKLITALPRLRKLCRQNNVDIVHSHTRVTQLCGILLSRIAGCVPVTTCHGFFRVKLSRRILPCWGRAVIAISRQVAEHLQRDFGVSAQKIHMIHNGIDLSRFVPVDDHFRSQIRSRYGLGNEKVIGIIARLSDVKGHDVLVEAMPRILVHVPDARLMIVGEGKRAEFIEKRVQDLGLQQRVDFFPVSGETEKFLPVFDCFVMPSRQEGLGLSVMEAQSVGMPVVASNVGGLPDIIEHEVSGLLVPPGDADALAGSVIRVLRDRELSRRLGENARSAAVRFYGVDLMADRVLDVYMRVAGQAASGKTENRIARQL